MKPTDVAWAAGFFDGEGCFWNGQRTGRPGQRTQQVRIQQKDREVLDRFCEIVGVGRVYGPYLRRDGRTFYAFQNGGRSSSRVIYELLLPYLGTIKRAQGAFLVESDSPPPAGGRAIMPR